LGGLGATEGPSATCNWTTAGLVPQLLPWLAMLALLALKPNRGWSAWWIWLPLASLAGGCHCLKLAASRSAPNALAEGALGLFLEVPVALALGLAALWLLAPYLDCRRRFRAFLGMLTVLTAFTVFSFAARVGWGLGVEPIASLLDPRHCAATANLGVMALPFIVPLVLATLGLAAAMVLCGLACQGRHRPFGLYPRFFVSLLAVWVGMSALLYVFGRTAWPGGTAFAPFIPVGLFMTVVTFAIMLPFLILSSVSPFFRERLKSLLHLKPEAPPAIEAGRVKEPEPAFTA
jgi:hypothetical protein